MFPPRVEGITGGVEGEKPETPAQGVPAPAPAVPADAPAQPVDAEAEWNTRIAKEREATEVKWKRDMDRLRSSLDSQHSREMAQRDREIKDLTSRLESDLLSRMTEEERRAYEEESRSERMQRMQEELEQERAARQATVNMLSYAQRLTGMGVNLKGIEFTDPENFFREADVRFEEYIRDLQSRATAASTPPPPPAAPVPTRPTPPQVVTATGTPPAQLTPDQAFNQVRKQLSQQAGREITEDELWRMAESGQLDLTKLIPGLS